MRLLRFVVCLHGQSAKWHTPRTTCSSRSRNSLCRGAVLQEVCWESTSWSLHHFSSRAKCFWQQVRHKRARLWTWRPSVWVGTFYRRVPDGGSPCCTSCSLGRKIGLKWVSQANRVVLTNFFEIFYKVSLALELVGEFVRHHQTLLGALRLEKVRLLLRHFIWQLNFSIK